jgi:hypothetical protein
LQDSIVGARTLAGALVAPFLVGVLGVLGCVVATGLVVVASACVLGPSLHLIGESLRESTAIETPAMATT